MSDSGPVVVQFELTNSQALALAHMLKRLHWPDARMLALSDDEADLMITAVVRLESALDEVGYPPH